MRRDSIFYKLFKQLPGLLFELIEVMPPEGDRYRFDSVEVKETAFRIDGVFLPPDDAVLKKVFFAEVQLQKDEDLYRRFFSEIFLFLRRVEVDYEDWEGVLIYGSRSMEPSSSTWYRSLLSSSQIHRIYLDELGDWRELSLPLGVALLTTASEEEAPAQARFLLGQELPADRRENLIELISTIMFYKFSSLPREAIAAMLNIQDVRLEDTRVYQDIQEEVRLKDRQEMILGQLSEIVDSIPETMQAQIVTMTLEQLSSLSKALLHFRNLADLEAWIAANL
jgi:predicted transposase/invertase (TIGR01784 family)